MKEMEECKEPRLLIPQFYLISSNPDRENTEDWIRNNFDPSKFYDNLKDLGDHKAGASEL